MGDHHRTPTRPVARKTHQCIACYAPISPGETYVQQTGFWEDMAYRNRFHRECWDTLIEDGEFEFSPGELDPPERLRGNGTPATADPEANHG